MTWILIIARIVHIFSAVLWAGGFATFLLHVQPALNKTMPSSQPFFLSFIKTFSPYLLAVGPLTLLGGAFLYWNDSGGLRVAWITTHAGLGFTFGALCGIAAWIIGIFVVKPRVDRLAYLIGQVTIQNAPPSSEQRAEMGQLSLALVPTSRAALALLGFALLGMATARYL